MMTTRFFVLVALCTLLAGCSSSAPTTQPATSHTAPVSQPEYEADPPPPFPDWFLNVPSEPGQAFYGVGVAGFRNSASAKLAQQVAATQARRQIADTLQTTVQGATKSYARQILTGDGTVAEESLSQDVTRAVTDITISGVAILKYETGPRDPETGLFPMYALARIGFDAVAETLHSEMADRVEQVRRNADEAFAELDSLLADQQEKEDARRAGSREPALPKESVEE